MAGRKPLEKSFTNMLRIAIAQAMDGPDGERVPKLRMVAEQLVSLALKGDLQAIREIADRIDGKPMQAIEHSGEIEGSTKEQREAAIAAAILAAKDDADVRQLN
jgi:ribosomal protein L17